MNGELESRFLDFEIQELVASKRCFEMNPKAHFPIPKDSKSTKVATIIW
jgi:hypothetical protein